MGGGGAVRALAVQRNRTSTTKLTSLTINNSLYAKTKAKGSLTMTDLDKLTNLTLNNVTVAAAIELNSKVVSTDTAQSGGGQAHTLTLLSTVEPVSTVMLLGAAVVSLSAPLTVTAPSTLAKRLPRRTPP